MKNTLSSLVIILVLFAFASCNQKEAQKPKPFANDKEFSIVIGTDAHTSPNIEIEDPIEFQTRGPADVVAASAYLENVAVATNGIVKIADALKGKKLTTFQAWITVAPLLIGEIKPIVIAGKSLKGIREFYDATQGLTIDERATVANHFSQKFSIPFSEAEQLTELLAESAVVNMKLAEAIKGVVKK